MYPIVIKSWRDNWERLTEYFQYTPAIRKLIYTTNTVEGYHRQVRKVTKTKGVFPLKSATYRGLVGFCLQSDKIHFIVHISCTTEMSQTQNPLTP